MIPNIRFKFSNFFGGGQLVQKKFLKPSKIIFLLNNKTNRQKKAQRKKTREKIHEKKGVLQIIFENKK